MPQPSLFHRICVVAAVALTTVFVVVLCLLAFFLPTGCASTKPILREVDQHVQLACEGLAQALAQRSGANAQSIINATCAVENITRSMRELLLSQQIEAAKAAGVAVPAITSDKLEPDPYNSGEAAAE